MMVLFYALIAAAIATMLYALVLALQLRKTARGGAVGKVVKVMIVFIAFFFLAYLASPLLPRMPGGVAVILTAVVFLFGAIFVAIVLKVILSLMQQIYEELDL